MSKSLQFTPWKDGGGTPFPVEDYLLPLKETYNGNILIKKAFSKPAMNMMQIIEAAKCANDPVYFIENYCRIISLDEGIIPFKLYDYQKEMIAMYVDNRFCLTLTARQMGKCFSEKTNLNIRRKTIKGNYEYYDNIPVGIFYEFQCAKRAGEELPDLEPYRRLFVKKNP